MDKYVSVNKIKAKVISGEPVLFSEATQHEIFFLLELEPSEDVEPVTHAHWKEECSSSRRDRTGQRRLRSLCRISRMSGITQAGDSEEEKDEGTDSV